MKASFTVEAAMILPIFFFACIFLVYIGIYQYDRCIAEQNLRYVIVRSKELTHASDKEREKNLQEMVETIFAECIMPGITGESECDVSRGKIKVSYNGIVAAKLLTVFDGDFEREWELQAEGTAKVWKPVEFIRLYSRIKGEE